MTNEADENQSPHDTNAYAPPLVAPEAYKAPHGVTKAQRLAGVCLVVGASLNLAERVLEARWNPAAYFPYLSQSDPLMYFLWIPIILPILIILMDFVLGLMIIAKKQRFVAWAIIRIVFGLLIIVIAQAYYLRKNELDLSRALLVFAPGIALLVLLGGRNLQKLRIGLGGVGFGLCSMVTLWTLSVAATGVDPFGWAIQTANGTIETEPVEEITGRAVPYKLKLPPNKWYLARNNTLGDGTEADRWLIRPDIKAELLITLDASPDVGTIPDDYTTTNVKSFQENKKVFVRKREPLRTHPDKGHLVLFDNEKSREPDGWILGIVTTYRRGYFIQAFAPKRFFSEIEPELQAIIESLELPPDLPIKGPDDCEPNAVTRVEGLAQKYAFNLPAGRWYQRKTEAMKKDDPATDRWLVRPEKDAHIWVIIDSVPSGEIDLDQYTESVAKTITAATKMTLLSRDRPRAREGRILKAKGHNERMEYRYLYGIYVDGPNAYQVIAVTRSSYFDEMEADFTQVIEQFELPKAR